MAKRIVMVAVGLFYVAAAASLVEFQAVSYRRALRSRRASLLVVPTTVASVVKPAPTPAPVVEQPEKTTPVKSHRPRRLDHPPRTVIPGPSQARTTAVPKAGSYESPVKLKPLVIPGLESAPASEEAIFGEALNKLILINHPAVDDPRDRQRLLDAVQPMLDLRDRKDVEIKLVVLDSNAVNSFSHLGGYLYVTRGLLNFAGTDEEFRFVIGHELAHLDLKHGQALLAEATRDGLVAQVGSLQAMYHLAAKGYTDAQEFAADDLTLARMLKLDHTTRECLMYLRKLRRLSDDLDFHDGHKPPSTPPDATIQDLDNHLRAAPSAAERLKRAEARLNATPARPGAIGPPPAGP